MLAWIINYPAWLTRGWYYLTRTPRYPSEFDVLQPFAAVAAISGAKRQFSPGDMVFCDKGPENSTVTFKAGGTFYLVDRSTFDVCCKWKNPGAVG